MPKLATESDFVKTLHGLLKRAHLAHAIGPKEDCPFCLFNDHLHKDSKLLYLTRKFTQILYESEGDTEWAIMLILAVGIEIGEGKIPAEDCGEELDKLVRSRLSESGAVN